jgi:hypothetical protein
MAYESKKWIDRQVQFPDRRELLKTNIDNVYTVERKEGEILEQGNRFDAENMNNLELRVSTGFKSIKDSEIAVVNTNKHFTATNLSGVLDELFTSASNGKKTIATAIGNNASSTESFPSLAGKVTNIKNELNNGKKTIADAIGSGASSSETFIALGGRITKMKSTLEKSMLYQEVKTDIRATTVHGTSGQTRVNAKFDFIPEILQVKHFSFSYMDSEGKYRSGYGTVTNSSSKAPSLSNRYVGFGLKDVDLTGFTLFWSVSEPISSNINIYTNSLTVLPAVALAKTKW